MKLKVESEFATAAEAVQVLMEHLPASKIARLLASWQVGQGDYARMRDEMFAGETVGSLFRAAEKPGRKK